MPFLLSQLIEACRWLGALVVLALHSTNLFVNLGDIMSAPHAAPVYVWWFFVTLQFAHQAVVGFFVLSGYLVGGAVLKLLRGHRGNLRDYFIHRFSRIYLVLGPTLLLTLFFDQLGQWWFHGSGVYAWPMFDGHFSSKLFFANLASLQDIFFDYFGTNGPLWSLACEFWYYILFPLLMLPFATRYAMSVRVIGFSLGAALCFAFARQPGWFGFGLILWSMGAFATLAPRPVIRSRSLALALYIFALLLIRFLVRGPLLAEHPWMINIADLSGATLLIGVLLAFRDGPHEGYAFLRSKMHKRLADFSFSLYAIHMPMLIFARAAASQVMGETWVKQLAQPANYLLALIVMATIILTALGFSRLTEAKTGAARRFLHEALNRIAPETRAAD